MQYDICTGNNLYIHGTLIVFLITQAVYEKLKNLQIAKTNKLISTVKKHHSAILTVLMYRVERQVVPSTDEDGHLTSIPVI